MRVFFFSLFFLGCCVCVQAQKPIYIDGEHTCTFEGKLKSGDFRIYDADPRMVAKVKEIADVVGLGSLNIEVKVTSVPNAAACRMGDKEYIFYSAVFMDSLLDDTKMNWAAYGILAHEVAHLLLDHTLDEGPQSLDNELAADKFSGWVLKLMGATKEQALSAVKTTREVATVTHPGRSAREEAVFEGWKKGGVPVPQDRDGDGIPDRRDLCPDEYGMWSAQGCPDADGDGVPDKEDDCPWDVGMQSAQGCPDADGDGVPDKSDLCPNEYGMRSAHGCPDSDKDGVPDKSDKCPKEKGERRFQGCPDSDGDGVPDYADKCPAQAGVPSLDGCPASPIPDLIARIERNMVFVQGGRFTMGCTEEQGSDCDPDEKPPHEVELSDYYIGKYEVTNEEYAAFLNEISDEISLDENGDKVTYKGNVIFDVFCGTEKGGCSGFKEMIEYTGGSKAGGMFRVVPGYEKHPVVLVSWYGARAYASWLSEKTGKDYRLPTEAEWEYAARGGQKSKGYKYAGTGVKNELYKYANFCDANCGKDWKDGTQDDGYAYTAAVGQFLPNELGLYDMSGNVWEWCHDWYGDEDYYKECKQKGVVRNPKGPVKGSFRVYRGGSWNSYARGCRVSYRSSWSPDSRINGVGFRLARSSK